MMMTIVNGGSSSSEDCRVVNGHGVEYEEFTCLYPSLAPFYFSWERQFDPAFSLDWMAKQSWIPVVVCLLYAIGMKLGQSYFETREKWKWSRTLAVWNAFLATFSFIGFWRVAPQLVHNLYHLSLRDNMCTSPETLYSSGSTGLWVLLFAISKFPELLDTFFIVIHKKPLLFLHWYHHITVLLYCWYSYVTGAPTGIFFGVMNYAVHSVMYLYYFLMAIHCKPKWFRAIYITTAQISQMVVGIAVTCLGFYYSNNDKDHPHDHHHPKCQITAENNTAAFVMYGSYLFLFLQFFVERYRQRGNNNNNTTTQTIILLKKTKQI